MQRLFDIVFSVLALAALSPLLLPIVMILRFTGEGEVLYKQRRVGLHGEHFGLLKFATMLKDSPNIGAGEITVRADPRILPFGRFLRKTKLNELPQLFNILKGDLSLVGPRPMVPSTFSEYPAKARERLCQVRPGLTGIGSVFFRDEEEMLDGFEDALSFYREVIIPYKADLEMWYVERRSIRLYFLLILLTAWAIPFPGTTLPQRLLKGLPRPPDSLRSMNATSSAT